MNRSPIIEMTETLTYSLFSNEIGMGDIELTVTCRIAYDMSNGMYCEPTNYNFDGTDHAVSGSRVPVGFDAFIKKIVASEMTAERLENVLREYPEFEEARRHEFDLRDTARAEYREAVL